jgi:DNA-binding IscR family transcriptional regulator
MLANPARRAKDRAVRTDSRLSRMLHVLLHMARHDGPMTSEKGHGGGWAIAADLDAVSLLDVHRAVGGPRLFAIGNEHPDAACAVEQVVNAAVEDALREAEALLVARLGAVSLAELARSFAPHCSAVS